jgi:hypothetical protein
MEHTSAAQPTPPYRRRGQSLISCMRAILTRKIKKYRIYIQVKLTISFVRRI